MTPDDEYELHRLTDMLAEIDAGLPASSPLREALQKSGLAISYAFIDGRRAEIENVYGNIDGKLTNHQKECLRNIGIDPDADS